MKIVHLCLLGTVTNHRNYQENLLTKYQKKAGHEVTIITSRWIQKDDGTGHKLDDRYTYVDDNGVKFIRLPMKGREYPYKKFKRFKGLYAAIENEQPDFIFIHGVNSVENPTLVRYLRNHKGVVASADNHADFSNSATNWFSKNILQGIIGRHFAKALEPYVKKFYGVLPARVDFLTDIYGISGDRVELLVMGADDELVEAALQPQIKKNLRSRYDIAENDFLIMTGGKIDMAKKQTLLLMDAVNQIVNANVKLIVFGSVVPELKDEVDKRCSDRVQYIGWIESEESYQYFASSDLVVFPGRHSVFWEQVVGQGIPLVVKRWDGTTHVDIGGNVKFLYEDEVDEIRDIIEKIVDSEYVEMWKAAHSEKREEFLYSGIAKQTIKEII